MIDWELEELKSDLSALREALDICLDYIDRRADVVELPSGRKTPNEALIIMRELKSLIPKHEHKFFRSLTILDNQQ